MQKYLLDKARKQGFKAWPRREGVAIVLPFAIVGKCNGYTVVEVHNVQEYISLIGGI